jgi:phenylacetate-CoA ligase
MMKYFKPEVELLPRKEIVSLQESRLRRLARYVYEFVPFYRKRFNELGVSPTDIRDIDDIRKLPFTLKSDLRDNYPFGMFAVNRGEIVRLHASSGTTGKPTVVGYTQNDLNIWSELVARALVGAGVSKYDTVHIAYGYGLFTGGLGLHYGVERLGGTVVPSSGGQTKRQIQLIMDFEATAIACTPSYLLHLADVAEDMGLSLRDSKLRVGVLGAEPWSEEMRKRIEERIDFTAVDIYGLSEIMGPGVACECLEKDGLHVAEDAFIAEIIDPNTLEPLPPGEVGELVITTLLKEGIPLIRYRTRDLTRLNVEPCICGRTHARISRILGRSDDMLIIRGVNVFPSQIESALAQVEGTSPHYLIIVDRDRDLDTIEVWVEVLPELFTSEVRSLERLQKKVADSIYNICGISVKVKLVEPKSIERSEGKAKRVIDKRKINK